MNRRDFLVGSMGSVLPLKAFSSRPLLQDDLSNLLPHPRELIYGHYDPYAPDREVDLPDSNYPEKVPGVEFYGLRRPVTMTSRYPTWVYDKNKSTVYSIRRIIDQPANPQIIRAQNEELENYDVQVDILQFNPNPRPDNKDWDLFRDNYLAVSSARPFFVLYENHFGTRYQPERKDLKNGVFSVDLSRPHNRNVLFDDMKIIMDRFVLPHSSRYVTHEGRAFVYFWASQIFRNAKPVFEELKRRFPVFLIGAEDAFHINRSDDAKNRVSAMDGFMPYALYRAGMYVGKYNLMRDEYLWHMIKWSEFLKKNSKQAKLFGTLQVAFDDSRVPWSKRTPMYPGSVDEVCRLATAMRSSTMGNPDLGFILDGAVHAVYDEYFEGAAIEQSFSPEEHEQNYEIRAALSGTVRLEIMKYYF